LLREVTPQMLGNLDAVARHALDGHRLLVRAVAAVGPARAALVPLHDGEVPLPRPEAAVDQAERAAGSAVQDEQHGIAPVLAADRDELVDAADPNKALLLDAMRRGDCQRLRILMLPPCAIAESADDDDHDQANEPERDFEDCPAHARPFA